MADDHKPGFWQRVKRGATRGLLWVAVKLCQVIVVVVDTIEAVVEVVKEIAKAAVEISIAVIQRVRENVTIQNIGEGIKTVREVIDVPELLRIGWRTLTWLWAFAMGQACASATAPSWVASSGLCALYGGIYFLTIMASGAFALYVIGLLSTVFRR